MEQRITMVGLGVSDLSKSEHFYIHQLGWEKSPASNDDIIFINLQGIYLSLYPREKLAEDAHVDSHGSGFKGFALAHNAKSIEEVDRLFTHFKTVGIEIVKPPQKVFWGGYSGYIADPDGHLWEVAFNPFMQLDDKGRILE